VRDKSRDIWKQYGFRDDDNADMIIHRVNTNVLSLVQKILKEKPQKKDEPRVLIHVGNKGFHLFSQHRNMIEQSFHTSLCRVLSAGFTELRPAIPPGEGPSVLVTDTVHRGSEMAIVLKHLLGRGFKVKRIFCYLKNAKGVQRLVKEDLIEEEKIEGLFSSTSEEEYKKESRQLQLFFRSIIEPMDPDSCYNEYNVDKILRAEELKEIVSPILEDIYGSPVMFKKSVNRGLASNIKEACFIIEDPSGIKKIAEALFQEDFHHEIEWSNPSFKINQKMVDSDFTAMMNVEASCLPGEVKNYKKCVRSTEKCLLKTYQYDRKRESELRKILCPACADLQLSDQLLNRLNPRLIKAFARKGMECKLKWRSRPIEL